MSETQEQATETPSVMPEAQPTVHLQIIYCGPTLPRQHGLQQYQVFNNGLPAHLEQVIAICPAINSLIVPVDELAQTRIAISIQGSAQSSLYQQIVKAVKK
jgi:hypothetical protein